MHTTVIQNIAHRTDLTWIRVGRSEHMRGDGVTIAKHARIAGLWEVRLPCGTLAQRPVGDGHSPHIPASAPTLSLAKEIAEDVTPLTPRYEH